MRLNKWFISNLDDSQRAIIIKSIDENIVVKGVAGSGKTNLAIHRALQAKNKGTYAIVILTVALKRMVAYGMEAVGLDKERIAYDWAFTHRGFDITGDVYCDFNKEQPCSDTLYLVVDNNIRCFSKIDTRNELDSYSIDFADWVDDNFYRAFGRRDTWYVETDSTITFSDIKNNPDRYRLVPSGIMFKPAEKQIDYLIVDEAQDFKISDYTNKFLPLTVRSLSLFGDSAQKMNPYGDEIEKIAIELGFPLEELAFNYRLPKSIARMAQQLLISKPDLISKNKKDNGNSDYPIYPKPIVKKYNTEEDELKAIAKQIKNEDMDDVAILVPNETLVMKVNKFFEEQGMPTQTHYRTRKTVPFNTINTLDFSNNDLPCVLTYYAAKGSEFENVFVPFSSRRIQHTEEKVTEQSYYVACTRSSKNLFISYSGEKNSFLSRVSNDVINNR